MNEKALLIDDHTLFLAGLESFLKRQGIKVTTVDNGKDGIRIAGELTPDIVLLDIRMPQMGGLAVLRQLLKNDKNLRVVILTTSTNAIDLLEALRAGAQGYLLKDIDPDDLVLSIRKVMSGQIIVAPELSSSLAQLVRYKNKKSQEDRAFGPFSVLTPRQYETLVLLAKGQSNKVIARELDISPGTVKIHVKGILRGLNVSSRVAAAIMLIEYQQSACAEADN